MKVCCYTVAALTAKDLLIVGNTNKIHLEDSIY